MPSFSASFNVRGNVSGATRAVRSFKTEIQRLNSSMDALNRRAQGLTNFNNAVSSFSRRSHAFVRNSYNMARGAHTLSVSLTNLATAWRDLNTAMAGGRATRATQQAAQTMPTAPPAQQTQAAQNAQATREATASAQQAMQVYSTLRTVLGQTSGTFGQLSGMAAKVSPAMGIATVAAGTLFGVIKGGVGVVQGAVQKINHGWDNMVQKLQTGLIQVKNVFMNFTRMGLDAFDGMRMIFLGMTNIFRSFFFFVSAPLMGAFYNLSTAYLDFEDALKRVQKTTALTNAQMETELVPGLRSLARETRTSHVELATMAEQAGQLGLHVPKSIMRLVEIGNMMAISTDLWGSEVVETLGRIANAFGWNLDQSSDSMWRMANVINILENETASSAAEIVEAIEQFAPIAATINLTAADTAALGASLVSMGWDASRAGTSLRNVGVYMARNAKEIAGLMGAYDKYNTTQAFTKSLNDDFMGTLLDVINALGAESDLVMRLTTMFDEFNLRGGRGVASLSENLQQLVNNLELARVQWEKSNSLIIEYDRAMSSAQAQLEVLRNNITDLGISIGNSFLPSINKAVQLLIGLVQILNDAWGALDSQTQIWIVLGAAILTFGGPALFFISQIIHGIFLMFMGIFQFTTIIPRVIAVFLALIRVFGTFGGMIRGWPTLLAGAGILILRQLQKAGHDIAGFFENLADKALAWGTNLAATFSSGLLQGAARWIGNALHWIGNLIARFLRGSSPPPQGVLSTIDKWGRKVIDAYLKGFALADFSILEQVGNTIQRVLDSIALRTGREDSWVFPLLAEARVQLAKLIETFNRTGEVAQEVLARAVSNLGDMGEAVADLIKKQLEYNRLQRQLDEIERKRQSILNTYEREVEVIAASTASAEERAELIRKAMRNRDRELKQLAEEERDLKEQRDLAKEQFEWQQAYVNALIEQEDILNRLLRAIDRLAGAMENLELPFVGDLPDPEQPFEQFNEELYNLKLRIENAKTAISGLFAALRGEDPMWEPGQVQWADWLSLPEDAREDYRQFYELGVKIRDVWFQIRGAFDGLANSPLWEKDPALWETLTQDQQEAYTKRYNQANSLYQIFSDIEGVWKNITTAIGGFWAALTGAESEEGKLTLDDLEKKARAIWVWLGLISGVTSTLAGFKTSWDWLEGVRAEDLETLERFAKAILGIADAFVELIYAITGRTSGTDGADHLLVKVHQGLLYLSGFTFNVLAAQIFTLVKPFLDLTTTVLGFIEIFLRLLALLGAGPRAGMPAEPRPTGNMTPGERERWTESVYAQQPSWLWYDQMNNDIRAALERIHLTIFGYDITPWIEKFYEWGRNLIGSLFGGVTKGAEEEIDPAMEEVGGWFSRYLAGRSPPAEGPLSQIDLWGQNLIKTYLAGVRLGITTYFQDYVIAPLQLKVQNLITDLKSGVFLTRWVQLASAYLTAFKNGMTSNLTWGNITSAVTNAVSALARGMASIGGTLWSLGKSLWDALIAGFLGQGLPDLGGGESGSAPRQTTTTDRPGPGQGGGRLSDEDIGNWASGGPFSAWDPMIVGEDGPEALMPNVSGYVASHRTLSDALAEASGGGSTSVHIHNPVVREDADIERIARAVERVLARRTRHQMSMGKTYG